MSARTFRRVVTPVVGLLSAAALAACDADATAPEPVPGDVILDSSGTLEAIPNVEDTIDIVVPDGRVMGTIIEASQPIRLRYGPGRFDVVHSGFGGAFGAIVPQVGTGPIRLLVQRSTSEQAQADYRVRIIAVDDAPEHRAARVGTGSRFRREFIDPPLDRDVFEVELEEGTDFFVDLEPLEDDVLITAFVVPPTDVPYYMFIEAGAGMTRSEVRRADEPGTYRLVLYSAGLRPDVDAEYRFRVVLAGN